MGKEFKKRGFNIEPLKIFGIANMDGWCIHYLFPNRDYGLFEIDGNWNIVRRDVKEFLGDKDKMEYLVSWVVKDVVINNKSNPFYELYDLVQTDLEIS